MTYTTQNGTTYKTWTNKNGVEYITATYKNGTMISFEFKNKQDREKCLQQLKTKYNLI